MSVRMLPIKDIGFDIVETAGAGGVPVIPPDRVGYSLNSTADWYVQSDQGKDLTRMDWREKSTDGETWEMRFTASGSEYYDFSTDFKFAARAPFEVWNLGVNTPGDPSDDRRVVFEVIDDDGSGGWSMGDRIYVVEVAYSEPLPAMFTDYNWPDDFHIGRIVFSDYSGNGQPAEGTVVRFTAKEFIVNAESPSSDDNRRRASVADANDFQPVLGTAYPNPFNASTSISYDVRADGRVTLEIFNVLGQRTRTLVDEFQSTGPRTVTWNGTDDHGAPVASGMYFCRLQTAVGTASKKLVLLK